MKPSKKLLAILLSSITILVLIAIFGIGDSVKGVKEMRYGIDIRGGVEAIFEPQNLSRKATEKELETARLVIETRLDAKKIADREVTVDKKGGYIIVRFPWKSDEAAFNPEDAISELGEMAQLTFRDPEGNVLVKGSNITKASPEQQTNGVQNEYVVSLNFDAVGSTDFANATEKLVGQNMGIYMDDQLISNPTVETKITGGKAVINGMEDFAEAQNLADKINAGSLPFSLSTTNFSTISPSLGNNALKVMVVAGAIAFILVCLFMIFYYRLPGIISCFTLLLQMTLQLLAISIPQYTLTLPGIAGIILSLGMAVDANIIISERITEELKKGLSLRSAVKSGYKNAFSSVLDGNITTAIVAVILMFFGSGSMLSFGYTLLAGTIINVIIGVNVSKHLLLSVLEFVPLRKDNYFRLKKEVRIKSIFQKRKIFAAISGVLFLIGIAACVRNGVHLDTQFTGGVVINYSISTTLDTEAIKDTVEPLINRPLTVQITENQITDTTSLVLTLAGNEGISPNTQKEITDLLAKTYPDSSVTLAQTYVVEPYIGAKALKNAGIAIILSIIFILLYVWIRFSALSGIPAGITSVLALVHDVIIVFFSFVVFGIPLNDAFVAVVLTIIGYSINDTIVVYDRIRENRKANPKMGIVELVNESVSQTLARSINTSITTGMCVLIILVASFMFHIPSITQFSLPMFLGLISGCYSSVCIAATLWALWERRGEKIEKVEKVQELETTDSPKGTWI
ncbi:MAG: protein translocase subunit SecD [Acetivibrio sp.]